MGEINKEILHVSCTRHQLIDDIYYYRLDEKGINDKMVIGKDKYEEVAKLKNRYDIILFHFIDTVDMNFILELMTKNPQKKFGFYLHTFYPFCSDGTCLSSDLNKDARFKLFISKLSFVIVQDNFSFNFINKYLEREQIYDLKILTLLQGINKKGVIGDRTISDRFRLGFVGGFSYIKGFDTIRQVINNYGNYLNEIGIDFKLFTIENPGDNVLEMKSRNINNVSIIYNEYDRRKIFSMVDCLIIPSIWNETGPMVLYESFANKIPVVISDQESLKEKVIDRLDSYVFKTGDEKDLLKGILWMKQNYKKMISGKRGFRYNTIENFNKELTNFLDEL